MLKFRLKKQAIMVSFDDLEVLGRSSSMVISLMNDRMKSSMRRGDQFHDDAGYYIIYTINELAQRLGCSKGTVNAILIDLKSKGYIVTKQLGLNRPNKIYLPKFADNFEALDDVEKAAEASTDAGNSKIEFQESQKLKTNQSYYNHNSGDTVKTVNTLNTDNSSKSETKSVTLTAIKKWRISVKSKLKLDDDVINAINYVCGGDADQCYRLTGLMNNAKWHVVKTNNLYQNPKTKCITRYEHNVNLKTKLCNQIMYIATKLPEDDTEQAKYWTTALIDYFEWAFGLKDYSLDLDPAMGVYSRSDKLRYESELNQVDRELNGEVSLIDPPIPTFKIK